jgi:RNA polymerase sigma-70 factor (ECF subfamily)
MDDEQAKALIRRCAERDESALEHLHRTFHKRIFLFAFNRLRNDDDAREVVNETLFRVWQAAARFKGESMASTWVLGIAKNVAAGLRGAAQPPHEDIEDHAETVVDEAERAEELLQRRQDESRVRTCLERLSPAHRDCAQLIYLSDLSLEDVARLQGVPVGTVKSRALYLRKYMRLCLDSLAA